MSPVLYAIACVLVPAAWGTVVYYAFGAIDRRRQARVVNSPAEQEPPPIDYFI